MDDDDGLRRAFVARTEELELAQRQLLAFRLESSLRAAFVAELQQSLSEALTRAERAEHELQLLRLAASALRLEGAFTVAEPEGRVRAEALRLLVPALEAALG